EVRAALAAARQKVGDRRLWAVFEPHMYSRTALFLNEFAESFGDADEVVVADIFASRDSDLSVASAAGLADAIDRASGIPALAGGDVDETARYVAEHLRSGDAVLVMGAGRSYRIARQLATALADGVLDRARGIG
ncbi:MAG TPA: cyanophycin synthetase, partial [Candidatus Limnocylindria bacterium]|nr:cyanophycin synthetase [Candidatus Limnocylindria bacterium]